MINIKLQSTNFLLLFLSNIEDEGNFPHGIAMDYHFIKQFGC